MVAKERKAHNGSHPYGEIVHGDEDVQPLAELALEGIRGRPAVVVRILVSSGRTADLRLVNCAAADVVVAQQYGRIARARLDAQRVPNTSCLADEISKHVRARAGAVGVSTNDIGVFETLKSFRMAEDAIITCAAEISAMRIARGPVELLLISVRARRLILGIEGLGDAVPAGIH